MGSPVSKMVSERQLRANTVYTDKEVEQWYKLFLSYCPTGSVSLAQFQRMYSHFLPHTNSHRLAAHIFRAFDKDADGNVKYSEFLTAIYVLTNGEPKEKLERTFRMYDVDDSGTLDVSEMISVMQDIYESSEEGHPNSHRAKLLALQNIKYKASKLFKRIDVNQNDSISKEEFINGCLRDTQLYALITNTY